MSEPLEMLHEGKWLALVKRGKWEFAQRTRGVRAACIVAITDDDEIVLVEQPRAALDGNTIELPAGLIGDEEEFEGESDAEAARRELVEETGYDAASMEYLTEGPSSAGLSSETLALYRARGLTRVGEGGGVAGEDITVHVVKLSELHDWLQAKAADGLAIDLKVWAGLAFATR